MSSFPASLSRTLATHLHQGTDTPCLSQKGIQVGEWDDVTTSLIFPKHNMCFTSSPLKDGPQTSSIGLTWNPLRNADSQVHPVMES